MLILLYMCCCIYLYTLIYTDVSIQSSIVGISTIDTYTE